MAIPGGKERQPVGKIRIGERSGKFAKSLNYFRSDSPLFSELVPGHPSEIEVGFFDTEAWGSGLEWWTEKKGGGNVLACYTKDSGSDPIALRGEPYLDDDSEVRGEKRGSNRLPISCPFRQCVHFKKKQCRPIGRLDFYLVSDPEKRPWRLDTKGWNSIESIEQALAENAGVLTWKLSVAFESKGNKRFPVLSLEPLVQINNDADIAKADALIALAKACENGKAREGMRDYLDATKPGWRNNAALIERLAEIGAEAAAENIFKKERAK